ncbi:MAG: hypothetical protein NVSMB55_13190 [Mycobacteriales bacterium]
MLGDRQSPRRSTGGQRIVRDLRREPEPVRDIGLHVDRHYTISKIGCWVALDRAFLLHERSQIATSHAHRWAETRDAIKACVNEHCWSQRTSSYTFYAGTDDLDAATLLAGPTGFETGPRLAGTIAAVRRELADGPLVYRYSGMRHEEGALLACTFRLVNALAASGDHTAATSLMDQAVGLTNDLGLLSEQIDPATGAMLGNVPQGLSHLALINAACAPGLKRNKRFHLHLTPTSSSWLNQVERWFRDLTTRTCAAGSSAASRTSSPASRPTSPPATTTPSPTSGPPPPNQSSPRSNAPRHPRPLNQNSDGPLARCPEALAGAVAEIPD